MSDKKGDGRRPLNDGFKPRVNGQTPQQRGLTPKPKVEGGYQGPTGSGGSGRPPSGGSSVSKPKR